MTVLITSIGAARASAQTVDPNTAAFDPSPDHNALDPVGVPLVTRYDLEFYLLGGTVPVRVVSLGKPAPDPDGVIRVSFRPLLNPPLPAGVTHEARVTAVGPGGIGRSAPSNSFLWGTPCTVTVSPASRSVAAGGGSSTFSVTAPAGCSWTAASQSSWISITSGANGTGNGTVGLTAAANTTGSSRSGTVTIAGQNVAVTQVSCSYTVGPMNPTVPAAGGTLTLAVTTTSGCTWTATESVGWISITAGSSGSGNGTVTLQISARTQTTQRSTTVTVAGRGVIVTQTGANTTVPSTPSGLRVIPPVP